ncbi:hypothetical protein [Flavobacterium foetidum]|uniref:hypothetical protein n=1 Tax=Flavobacterium foetidum TaxID=2026681 RepID=UPI001074A6F5|nr:hypothetical protein [Flavobacterium foetidum]KAF2513846.1 hypothetical protein E0W73_13545 [Flavobacterium foetidum]
MRKFLMFLLLIAIVSCTSKENQYKETYYIAVNGKDTAKLALKISEKRFFGRYERSYYKIGKDSGDVRGNINGDTLRGDFHYISNGGSWKRVPLALLRHQNKLIQGKGVVGIYMNLPCFINGTLTYKNPEFTFEEVKK